MKLPLLKLVPGVTKLGMNGPNPVVVPDADYMRNSDHRELLLSGLRLVIGEAE